MAVKLKDLLPLCAVVVEDEYRCTIYYSRFYCKKEHEQERKDCEKILAPYMDCEVKSITASYDDQWITIKGKKVNRDGD